MVFGDCPCWFAMSQLQVQLPSDSFESQRPWAAHCPIRCHSRTRDVTPSRFHAHSARRCVRSGEGHSRSAQAKGEGSLPPGPGQGRGAPRASPSHRLAEETPPAQGGKAKAIGVRPHPCRKRAELHSGYPRLRMADANRPFCKLRNRSHRSLASEDLVYNHSG